MSRPLLPLLPFHDDETVPSWAARLAAHHTGGDLVSFLLDRGLPLYDVMNREGAIAPRLAAIGGEDPERVRRNARELLPGNRWRMRGETIHSSLHGRRGGFACCQCLIEDAGGDDRFLGARLRDRLLWRLAIVTVCPVHGAPLVDLGCDGRSKSQSLPAVVAAARWTEVEALAARAEARSEPPLQRYVRARLDGAAGPSWLDGQGLDHAITACELLGFALSDRASAPRRGVDLEAIEADQTRGFTIATGGETAIREALREVQDRRLAGSRKAHVSNVFGRLCHWARQPANRTLPLACLFRDHVLETMPVGGDRELLGLPIAERRMHSVTSLAETTGLAPKRLRRILVQKGLVPGDDPRRDDSVAFDAAAGEAVARSLVGSLSLSEVAARMGVSRRCAAGLVAAGLLKPAIAPDAGAGLRRYAIARSEVDDLLTRLLDRADTIGALSRDHITIGHAAKLAGKDAAAILAALAYGRLRAVRPLGQQIGVAGLRLWRGEVDRVFPAGGEPDSLRSADAAKWLGLHDKTIAALGAMGPHGGVPLTRIASSNHCKGLAITKPTLETFDRTYVSVRKLARELGVSTRRLSVRLRALGLDPAFDPKRVWALIYRRDSLDAALDALAPWLAKTADRPQAAGGASAQKSASPGLEAAP